MNSPVNWNYVDQETVGMFYFLNIVVRQYPRPIKSQFHGVRATTI